MIAGHFIAPDRVAVRPGLCSDRYASECGAHLLVVEYSSPAATRRGFLILPRCIGAQGALAHPSSTFEERARRVGKRQFFGHATSRLFPGVLDFVFFDYGAMATSSGARTMVTYCWRGPPTREMCQRWILLSFDITGLIYGARHAEGSRTR